MLCFARNGARARSQKSARLCLLPNSSVFQARLPRLRNELVKTFGDKPIFSLVVAMVGEIGNNSFDHNVGSWPDIPGIFFCFNIAKRESF